MADIFIQFDGITGESIDTKHNAWIEASSFTEGLSAPGSTGLGTGGAVGKPSFMPFGFTTIQGKHTINIKTKMFAGQHFDKVKVSFVKTTGDNTISQDYYTIEMEHVFVTSYSLGKSENSLGHESYSIEAEKATWEYFSQGADGKLTSVGTSSYDQKKAQAA
jgi:type VI protein secretion system component Hcp